MVTSISIVACLEVYLTVSRRYRYSLSDVSAREAAAIFSYA